jgi:hypothetical protein
MDVLGSSVAASWGSPCRSWDRRSYAAASQTVTP